MEGLALIESSIEFFKNLPPKECKNCGETMEDMADCYSHCCEECEGEIH